MSLTLEYVKSCWIKKYVAPILPWLMKVRIFNKTEKLNNAEKMNNIWTNIQSVNMSVAQHLMTHVTQEKTLNQKIFKFVEAIFFV